MPRSFRSLSEVIYNEETFEELVKKANEQEIVEKFDEIFPELKKVAKAIKVNKNILYLKVENSVWRSELNLRQEAIIKKIKSKLKKVELKKIKFIS